MISLIGLVGFKGSGKGEVAKYLGTERCFNNTRFRTESFAALLKKVCKEVYGLNDEQLYGKLKEVVDPFWGVTPRAILQDIGTRGFRESVTGSDTWVRALERRIGVGHVVIDDVRFGNEIQMIRRRGGEIWLVSRPEADPGIPTDQLHESERLPREGGLFFDAIIHNDGDVLDLYCEVDAICATRGIR